MKKILTTLLMFFFFVQASKAKEINLIMANPPGSTSDIVMKIVGDEYTKLTGDKFIIDYQPAMNGATAAVKFTSAEKNTVLLGTTSMHVYNPVLEKDLPYKDSDFSYMTVLAWSPAIYISSAESNIKNADDLFKNLHLSQKPFIGGYAVAFNLSIDLLKNAGKLDKKVEVVPYKGAPDILVHVLNNTIPVGLVAPTPNLFQLAAEKKINILGSTAPDDFSKDGINVVSISKKYGVQQTNGGMMLSLKPNADPKFKKEFEENLRKVLTSDTAKEQFKKINVVSANVIGEAEVKLEVDKYRKSISNLKK